MPLPSSGLRFGLAFAIAAVAAAGCGGGSGSPEPPSPPPVVVPPPNGAPEANAGADQTVESGSTVTLDGSGSRDPDGDALDYSWRQTDGPSVDLAGADGATATFDAPDVEREQVLTFELEVDDGRGGMDSDEVDVTLRPATVSVCDRTPEVRDEIVRQAGAEDCEAVNLLHVMRLELADAGIESLRDGDFAGLEMVWDLDLSGNGLRELPVGLFGDLGRTHILNLDRNELATLPGGLFEGVPRLWQLQLAHNRIAGLPAGVFDGLTRLSLLDLTGHRFSVVPTGMFDGLDSLVVLWMGGEGEVEVVPGVFDGLPNLVDLTLGNYRARTSLTLHPGVFAGLPKLSALNMERAGLSELPTGLFEDVPTLRVLGLRRNRLTVLPEGLFAGLPLLEDLDLQNNLISDLGDRPFSSLASLTWLSLFSNHLSRVPDGFFLGLESIEDLDMAGNHGGNFVRFEDAFLVRVGLERMDGEPDSPSPARLRVRVPSGTPYDLTATVDVQNGSADRREVVVPRGGIHSEEFSVEGGGDAGSTHVSVRLRRTTPGVRVEGVGLQAEPAAVLFGETSNRAPGSVGVPAPHVVTADVSVARVANVGAYFEDDDGDALEVAATSSDGDVVEATVSDGTLELRPHREGAATVTLVATDPDGLRAWQDVPLSVEAGADPGAFDIALVPLSPHHETHNAAVRKAADHLSTVVIGDLPDVDYSQDVVADPLAVWPEVFVGIVDDVRILVDVGRVPHSGGGILRRRGTELTLVGDISVNVRADDAERVFEVGLHEFGHVLGIGHGPLWGRWLRDWNFEAPADTHFPGPLAVVAFDEAGGHAYEGAKVPVDNNPSRSPSHWRPSVLGDELMGPYGGVLSAITVQALADMGYVVDVSRAEPFEITLPAGGSAQGFRSNVVAGARSNTVRKHRRYLCGSDGAEGRFLEVCDRGATGEGTLCADGTTYSRRARPDEGWSN